MLETQQASRDFLSYQLNPNLSLGKFLSSQVYFVSLSRDNKFTDFERIFICFVKEDNFMNHSGINRLICSGCDLNLLRHFIDY